MGRSGIKASRTKGKKARVYKMPRQEVASVALEIKDASMGSVVIYRKNKDLDPEARVRIVTDVKVDAYKGIIEGSHGAGSVVEQIVRQELAEA